MAHIVLVHGILGFGTVLPMQPRHYFNGIKPLFESAGQHQVACPTLNTLGSLEARSNALEAQLKELWPGDNEPIFILAHSMGGLDCRRVLARNSQIARRVKRLITIATPHFGSPVATQILAPGPLGFPNPAKFATGFFADDIGAIADLRQRGDHDGKQDPDVTEVEYLCVGCDGGPPLASKLFSLTAHIGEFGKTRNDGVVSLDSASRQNRAEKLDIQWEVDHGAAIGWPTGNLMEAADALLKPPPDHIERYRKLLPVLVK